MRRVLLLVEGQTEEQFVAGVLRDHLMQRSIFPATRLLVTKFVKIGTRFKGGVTSWNQIERDLKQLLTDSAVAGVTTLLDFYGLPKNVPGMTTRPSAAPQTRVEHVERAVEAHFGDRRLRVHLMLHELEALLFTDITKWQRRFEDTAAIARLKRDVAGIPPELINETPDGAPSKRIKSHLSSYSKVLHGPQAAKDIGLDAIRAACPHFASWLSWIESLGDRVPTDSESGVP
jgi:hypothetical protein